MTVWRFATAGSSNGAKVEWRQVGAQYCRADFLGRKDNRSASPAADTLMHLCEIGSVGSYHSLEFIAVIVPGPELAARCASIDVAVIQRVSEALRLLSGYIRSL